MKHINLDREDKKVIDFIRSLTESADGSILQLGGKPVLQVVPVGEEPVDWKKLKAAIRKRRDESRELNKEWDFRLTAKGGKRRKRRAPGAEPETGRGGSRDVG